MKTMVSKNVHEWAMKTFGFKKSASYTLLKIGKEYTETIKNSKGSIVGYTSNLLPDSETDFTTTQIEKMLPAGHLVDSEEITPDMTCKEIEAIVKKALNPEETETEETETEETETEETETKETIRVYDENGNTYIIPVSVLNQYKE